MVSADRVLGLCGLLLCVAEGTARAQGSFTGIGHLGRGSTGSIAWGVSPDGRHVAAESLWSGFYGEVAVWSAAEGMRAITPGRASGSSGAINWEGTAVAGYFPGNGTTLGFRWTVDGGVEMLGDLPGGEERSAGLGMSMSGDVVVGNSSSANGIEAIRWTGPSGLTGLGDLDGGTFGSSARSISADGRVLVGNGDSGDGDEAMRWTATDGMIGLGALSDGRFRSSSIAVSADGRIIVGDNFDDQGWRVFRWTEATGMLLLDPSLQDIVTHRAKSISWDGSVVVGYMDSRTAGNGPFYWTEDDGTRWLTDVLVEAGAEPPAGWRLERAHGVSADGRTIVGYGTNPEGNTEGFVAYLGPACRSDFDDDGEVGVGDVSAYLAAWSLGSVFADWDYNGVIDTRDVIAFLREWAAKPGCG